MVIKFGIWWERWNIFGVKYLYLIAILLIGDGYFYLGRVLIFTVFPEQFLAITQSYRYDTEY